MWSMKSNEASHIFLFLSTRTGIIWAVDLSRQLVSQISSNMVSRGSDFSIISLFPFFLFILFSFLKFFLNCFGFKIFFLFFCFFIYNRCCLFSAEKFQYGGTGGRWFVLWTWPINMTNEIEKTTTKLKLKF